MKNKQWALAWLAEMDRIIKEKHSKDSWVDMKKGIDMLLEAYNILMAEVE